MPFSWALPWSSAVNFSISASNRSAGREAGDRFGASQLAGLQLGVERSGRRAVLALEHAGGFLGDGLVALAGQHVDHRLSADDLRSGRHQWNEAQVLAHTGNLLEHLV